jgi:signal transduction histidine kinase
VRYGERMIDRKLARPLVATFLVAVITFLASSGYTQLYLRKIDGDVDLIAHNASPTIQHATHVRIRLHELRLALAEAVHTAELGAPPTRVDFHDLEQNIARDLAAYFVAPFPNEKELWEGMRGQSRALIEDSNAIAVAVRGRDLEGARAAFARVTTRIDGLDLLLLEAIAINATTAHALAEDIGVKRAGNERVSLLANALSVASSLAAMLLALRALRRYAATLHTAEANLETLVASSPDAMLLEQEGRVVETNEAARILLGGAAREGMVGQPTAELLKSEVGGSGAPPPLQGEHRVRMGRPGGPRTDVEITEIALERAGRPLRVLVLRDVTSRLALEARLVMTDRLASVGTLAAGIAHEINNPLVYILHNLTFVTEELAGLKLTGERIDEIRDALMDANRGAERVRDIVHDLGLLARGDQGENDEVSVHLVLDASANIAAAKLRGNATLVKEYGAVPPLRGTAARLGQVTLNLIINAIHAMDGRPAGSEPRIVLRTSTSSTGEAVIEVVDNGKGIDPAILGRLFDPFFTTKSVGVGTGLGLSITHSIVSAWGGRIDVESVLGEGTTFRVFLPPAPPPSQVAEPAASTPGAAALVTSRSPDTKH